jgi:hypothetical protein
MINETEKTALCSKMGAKRKNNSYRRTVEKHRWRDYLEGQGVDGRILLKEIVKEQDGYVCIYFI